jgi:hypothetical protein
MIRKKQSALSPSWPQSARRSFSARLLHRRVAVAAGATVVRPCCSQGRGTAKPSDAPETATNGCPTEPTAPPRKP